MEDQISKVLELRSYIYNTDDEESAINPGGDLKNIERVTMSALRPALNRIKTDVRDLQASISAVPNKPQQNELVTKVFQEILNSSLLTDQNHQELYKAFDNILDMSYAIIKIKTENSYDEINRRICTKFNLENIPDIKDVFFDHSVPLSRVNKDGAYVGYCKSIEEDNKPIEIFEFWQKHFKETKYGVRRSLNDPEDLVAEPARNGVKYLRKYRITEVDYVSHHVWKNNELFYQEKWPYKSLPFILGIGVHIDNFSDTLITNRTYLSDRIALSPFAEHVKKPQMVLDYAASLQLYNIKMSRGTSKFMFEEEMLSPEQADIWKSRNVTDNDLPYKAPTDNSGNKIAGWKPEPVPDVPLSPTVSEALANIPPLINALLGVNLEQDITYNMSGEAINKLQMVRQKNAKLYTDMFLELLDDLGCVLNTYIPYLYLGKQNITIDNNGVYQNIVINSENVLGQEPIIISDLVKSHTIKIGAGKNRVSQDEQNRMALEQLYKVTSVIPDLSSKIISSTLDIYADSLDCPSSCDISQRIMLLMDPSIIALSEGKVTSDEIRQNNQQQQQQLQIMQQQMQQMNQQIESLKAQADMMDSRAKMVKAEADMRNANMKAVESHVKLKSTEIKANAEIAKSFNVERS